MDPSNWGNDERRYTRGWRARLDGTPISADTDAAWRMGWRDADAAIKAGRVEEERK